MRLTLAYHPVTDVRFGATTQLQGTTLEVSETAVRQYLLEDRRLQRVDLAIVHPGEACRFGVVFDILEPRAKEPGSGPDFPGILDAIAVVGQGITHVLQGTAVTVLDAAVPITGGQVVEMSGDAGQACPYAALAHLVIVPHVVPGLERHRALHALRLASVKAAVYLGRTAVGHPVADSAVFESPGPVEASRSGLPRLAYIGQVHSRQRVAEVDEQILYGANTAGMAPVLLHPNEWLDGAIVTSYFNRAVETYFYQNHPIILELYRWHREGKVTLGGTIATMAGSDNDDRARNAMLAAHQAKWTLAAEGVILTKYGGGAPHADMALTAKLCEELDMRTAVQASDMSQDRRAESALLFNYDEVDAIVYVGGNDTHWTVPAVPRVIAGTPAAAEVLQAAQVLDAGRLCGVTNQQGASHLRYNQNGWPTIAFLTPTGDDILRVNYLAPEPFINLLVRLVDAYQRDKVTILETAARNRIEAQQRKTDAAPAPLGAPIVAEIAGMLEGLADHVHGGYGTQAKFLHTEANDFLLYLSGVSGDRTYLEHVAFTLDKMRDSRTFDHKDGGFFRYSSRVDWREPHPEKLLDDQAGLLRNYLYTYLLTEQDAYRETAQGLIDYLNTTLTDPAQPYFWGCQDYVRPALPPPSGHSSGPLPLLALLDQYVYCDANARAASSYLEAWWLLGRDDCRERAEQILHHLWETLRAPTGEMYHYWDGAPHVPGLLMDTTMTGLAMLDAYALLRQPLYLERAIEMGTAIIQRHRNPTGGFFDISETGPASLQVPITVLTQNACVASFFVRLADLSGHTDYRKLAYWALRSFPNAHRQYEAFAAGFGHALAQLLTLPLYIAITGTPGAPDVLALARSALTRLRHGNVVLLFDARQDSRPASATVQMDEKQVGPLTDPAALTPELLMTLGQV